MFAFEAQSLDNSSPNPIYQETRILDPINEQDQRKALVNEINQLTIRVKPLSIEGLARTQLFLNKDRFVLEVDLGDCDVENRQSPILCYGQCPKRFDETWFSMFIDSLKDFTGKIERNVDARTENEIRQIFIHYFKENTLPAIQFVMLLRKVVYRIIRWF